MEWIEEKTAPSFSAPTNFTHNVHVGFDPRTGAFTVSIVSCFSACAGRGWGQEGLVSVQELDLIDDPFSLSLPCFLPQGLPEQWTRHLQSSAITSEDYAKNPQAVVDALEFYTDAQSSLENDDSNDFGLRSSLPSQSFARPSNTLTPPEDQLGGLEATPSELETYRLNLQKVTSPSWNPLEVSSVRLAPSPSPSTFAYDVSMLLVEFLLLVSSSSLNHLYSFVRSVSSISPLRLPNPSTSTNLRTHLIPSILTTHPLLPPRSTSESRLSSFRSLVRRPEARRSPSVERVLCRIARSWNDFEPS